MKNVHQRVLPVPAATAGALLDRLGTADDPLWPSPAWPPIRFDRPLGVGADGGHGPVRYAVSSYEPGCRVEFRFHPEIGLTGFHSLEVQPLHAQACMLTHLLVAHPHGRMRLLAPLVMRWLHDAVLEDLLDNAERATTGSVARPNRYNAWVRLLRRRSGARPRKGIGVPAAESTR